MHPDDAAARDIGDGDPVLVTSRLGSLVAGARISDGLLAGVVQLSTGAWYTPDDRDDVSATCLHGNPNVLTRDIGSSPLSQGTTGATVLVEVARATGDWPVPVPHQQPTKEVLR